MDSVGVVDGMTLRTVTLLTIFVYSVGGTPCTLDIFSDTRIDHVKHLVCVQTGLPARHQRLFWGLVELQDSERLHDHNIVNEAALQVVRLNAFPTDD